jgi:hypothetical protein
MRDAFQREQVTSILRALLDGQDRGVLGDQPEMRSRQDTAPVFEVREGRGNGVLMDIYTTGKALQGGLHCPGEHILAPVQERVGAPIGPHDQTGTWESCPGRSEKTVHKPPYAI